MTPLFLYLIKSSISLVILVIFYEVFQKREGYFIFNRTYLLLGIALVLFLPLWNYNFVNLVMPEADSQEFLFSYPASTYHLSEVTIGIGGTEKTGISVVAFLMYVYFFGVVLRTVLFITRASQLFHRIKRTDAEINDRIRFIFTNSNLPVFSFFNNIFISEKDYHSHDAKDIIAHEKVHISQLHSLDLLFAELLCIVQWFNPFAYILKKAIRENHEFIADKQVISNFNDPSKYRLLLLRYSSKIKTSSLAHNFSYSLLKRRLFMMKNPKKPPRIFIGLIGALVAFSFILFACSSPDIEELISSVGKSRIALTEDTQQLDVRPEFPGGSDSLFAFLGRTINYPATPLDDTANAWVIVNFIVDKDGSVGEAEVLKGYTDECSNEVLKAINLMPDWKPGMQGGQTVSTKHKVIVNFSPGRTPENLTESTAVNRTSGDSVFTVVKQMPEYPGGNESLVKFLRRNIKYPEKAKKDGTNGMVDVSFIIETDGTIGYAKVTKGLSKECDQEALRVINLMPAWLPGKNHGEVVRVALKLPIFFKLEYGSKDVSNTTGNNKDTVFTVVKQMPEFPGGLQVLMQYLGSNIKYPEQAKRDSIQGRVFVQFIVEKDGSVSGTKVLRGIGGGCDEEALRVVSSMPNWKPGLDENNEPVRVEYNIPIKYALK